MTLSNDRSNKFLTTCLFCRREFNEVLMKCPVCGGPLEIVWLNPKFKICKSKANIWRYEALLPTFSRVVTHSEGLTPISRIHNVLIKNERYNPTGTYSDRASALIASYVASSNIKRLRIKFTEDFTYSLSYYLNGIAEVDVEVCDNDFYSDELGKLIELGVNLIPSKRTSNNSNALELDYLNPLTIEGLKTIVFEIYEKRVKCEDIVVPAVTGLLTYSLWKGIKELKESGLDVNYNVVSALIKGQSRPKLIPNEVKVVEVGLETILDVFTRLCRYGIKLKPISTLAYVVAEDLRNSIAVITAGYRPSTKRNVAKGGIKEGIINLLSRDDNLTAYEIWQKLKSFTLRGVYKALKSLEFNGVVCSDFEVRNYRRVKRYRLCS